MIYAAAVNQVWRSSMEVDCRVDAQAIQVRRASEANLRRNQRLRQAEELKAFHLQAQQQQQ